MFKSSVLLMLLAACSIQCNVTSTCGKKEIYNSNLDLAIDLIVRAKYTLPTINESFIPKAMDCTDVLQMGHKRSGIYEIWPVSRVTDGKPLRVYCDMDTNGGGWTVIQRRGDFQTPQDYFHQNWESYKEGFGEITKDFWLGNDNIFALTNQKLYSARFDLKDVAQNRSYALYDKFWIADEDHNYTLHISVYTGEAGDSMETHNNQQFSTKDKDNDLSSGNCATSYRGGWWYNNCRIANLNGNYRKGNANGGIIWQHWKGSSESLEWTEIKIRPKHFRPLFALHVPP